MAPKGMVWDPAADRKLLLGVLMTQNISIDKEAMANYMSTDDVVCTVSAIENRVHKLKAMATKELGGDGSASGEGGIETPKPKGKGTGRKRAAPPSMSDDGEEGSNKKVKAKRGKVKNNPAEGNDGEGESGADGGAETAVKEEQSDDEGTL